MKVAAPSYYKDFRCIAQKCRHSCCRGWEIDIDPESLERFRALGIEHISEDGVPHFVLRDADTCPFLEDSGLCRLIIDHGEEVLCDICRDHPRFRNYWTGICETGLGISCEEAARIILSQQAPMQLEILGDGDENGVLESEKRGHGSAPAFDSLYASDCGCQKAADVPGGFGRPDKAAEAEALYAELPEDESYLYDVRNELLKQAAAIENKPLARLAEYLLYRHIADALYDGRLEGRIAFVQSAFAEISESWSKTDGSLEALVQIAREWSEKTEYNEELKDSLIESFEDQ